MGLRPLSNRRRGNVIVLSAFMMVIMLAMVAFACDVGYLQVIRTELQRSADAAALAAVWELADEDGPGDDPSATEVADRARLVAAEYASYNLVGREAPGLADSDVEIGYLADPSDPDSPLLEPTEDNPANAVRVHVRRTSIQNGEVPLFFARVMGYDTAAVGATATAAIQCTIRGFQTPGDGSNLGILPIALDLESWEALMAGQGTDSYQYSDSDQTSTSGQDGVLEINLYPGDTGSAGNRGTVDIGGANNSTSDIARQIIDGISPADMEALNENGGTLELDVNSQLVLQGDTGLSAEIKDELSAIIGQPRIVPLYSSVANPGNNAQYTIVKFVGIRVMYVDLTGKNKKVLVQPCPIVTSGIISSPGGSQAGEYIYSRARLVR
ncbi:MAG: pilus assembly protein TadG-related protein [Planctomycetaceae bacterium]|nr:pilus assembly protein TadG-related protein [Planctomycetaceae bacterium]